MLHHIFLSRISKETIVIQSKTHPLTYIQIEAFLIRIDSENISHHFCDLKIY